MKKTKIICPSCGAEFFLPEHQSLAIGIAVGKDSGLGTISPRLAEDLPKPKPSKTDKTEERLEALKAAGVDVSNIFAMQNGNGESMLARLTDDKVTVLKDDDPIFQGILTGKSIPERRLFRRWVMAQMFHMISGNHSFNFNENFNMNVDIKGYDYQWKMILEELRVQMRLAKNDPENFTQRNRWFNRGVVVAMAEDYIVKLRKHIKTLKYIKNTDCKRIGNKDVHVADIENVIIKPLEHIISNIKTVNDPYDLFVTTNMFRNAMPVKLRKCKMSHAWKDAYKGSGAYFTLKNLVLFHDCSLQELPTKYGFHEYIKGYVCPYKRETAAELLEDIADRYEGQGWRMFAYMKEIIKYNNIDIESKMKEWAA